MPLIPVILALLLVFGVMAVMVPLTIVQRYRMGTARRRARTWVATLNAYGMAMSATLFLITAAVTSAWVQDAFAYTSLGMAAGCTLGLIGLGTTRWEVTPQSVHFTPNRWLVLSIMLVVTARIGYSFWRGWQAWRSASDESSLLAAVGVAGSMAAGAMVIGYYLMYWWGVQRRLRKLPPPAPAGRRY
ncbi:MAG TPA: hypothetical protein VMS98_12235 [Thermoanaerobaculia bacterium]|nr:hypothetical protein [Thermoanaerobaculia bacterium]